MKISFIIVTHNSQTLLDNAIRSIFDQNYDNYNIYIIDNNSENTEYLRKYDSSDKIDLHLLKINSGYCGGNNYGINLSIQNSELLIIMNPDIKLPNNFLKILTNKIKTKELNFGVIGPKLVNNNHKNDLYIDSTGIFQRWYGKWYDRGQGSIDQGLYDRVGFEKVPAICGALMILNPIALEHIKLQDGGYFNEIFFMYKEDIDLSLRINNLGYGVYYFSELKANHLRGWKTRSKMSKEAKLHSAKNEFQINRKISFIALLYSAFKILLVKLGL